MPTSWPRASAERAITGRIKCCPADFRVVERLGIEPTGVGEHLLLEIEKTGLATIETAAALARAYGCAFAEVGYAGMKDKRAVTRQWFSLPVPDAAPAPGPMPSGVSVLDARRHAKKLRRGELAGNHFDIVVREVSDPVAFGSAIVQLARTGAPNYFGPQRFGRDNVERATAWLAERRRRRVPRFEQGLHLSVLRSLLFNEVLGARVAAGTWRELLPGDVADGGWPTGPLWGRGRSASADSALAVETAALAAYADIREGLEHAGARQGRRPLVLMPRAVELEVLDDRSVRVAFDLPPGGYATSLLGDVARLCERAREPAE